MGESTGKYTHIDIPFVGCNKKASESLWCCISVTDGTPTSNNVSYPVPFTNNNSNIQNPFSSFLCSEKEKEKKTFSKKKRNK